VHQNPDHRPRGLPRLYEAVAHGLAALRGREWIAGLQQQGMVKVSVAEVHVEHQVQLAEFTQWLERPGANGHGQGLSIGTKQ
jgi:hypothetical protein